MSYGVDTSCGERGYLSGRLVTGEELVIQAIFRRLTTPRGTLNATDEEAAYGLDVSGFVGAGANSPRIRALSSMIEAELSKDDRILSATAFVETSRDGERDFIDISLDVLLTEESTRFPLTIRVNQLTASIISGEEQQT